MKYSILLILFYLLYATGNSEEYQSIKKGSSIEYYFAKFEISHGGVEDFFYNQFKLPRKCKVIPIDIYLTIEGNSVKGEAVNRSSEEYIDIEKNCEIFHKGIISGNIDDKRNFKKVFIKHPSSKNNFEGLYKIGGSLKNPKLAFRQPAIFKTKPNSFNSIESLPKQQVADIKKDDKIITTSNKIDKSFVGVTTNIHGHIYKLNVDLLDDDNLDITLFMCYKCLLKKNKYTIDWNNGFQKMRCGKPKYDGKIFSTYCNNSSSTLGDFTKQIKGNFVEANMSGYHLSEVEYPYGKGKFNFINFSEYEKYVKLLENNRFMTSKEYIADFKDSKTKALYAVDNTTTKYYSASFKISHGGVEDFLYDQFKLPRKCKIIPIDIYLTIENNTVKGEAVNRSREEYIDIEKNCEIFHKGTISGTIDNKGNFNKVFITHPSSKNNLEGLYRIDGTLSRPRMSFKAPSIFKTNNIKFKNIDSFPKIVKADNELAKVREKEEADLKSTEKKLAMIREKERAIRERTEKKLAKIKEREEVENEKSKQKLAKIKEREEVENKKKEQKLAKIKEEQESELKVAEFKKNQNINKEDIDNKDFKKEKDALDKEKSELENMRKELEIERKIIAKEKKNLDRKKQELAQEEEKKIDEILERERINAEIKSVNDFIALQEERKIKALRKELERERIIIAKEQEKNIQEIRKEYERERVNLANQEKKKIEKIRKDLDKERMRLARENSVLINSKENLAKKLDKLNKDRASLESNYKKTRKTDKNLDNIQKKAAGDKIGEAIVNTAISSFFGGLTGGLVNNQGQVNVNAANGQQAMVVTNMTYALSNLMTAQKSFLEAYGEKNEAMALQIHIDNMRKGKDTPKDELAKAADISVKSMKAVEFKMESETLDDKGKTKFAEGIAPYGLGSVAMVSVGINALGLVDSLKGSKDITAIPKILNLFFIAKHTPTLITTFGSATSKLVSFTTKNNIPSDGLEKASDAFEDELT